MSNAVQNRYDFAFIFDVKDGNPNGDPDAGNLPRVDAETGCGLVTDVCLKRKVRNYVQLTKENEDGYAIYVQEKAILTHQQGKAYEALKDDKAEGGEKIQKARDWMCRHFFDIRAFGAVMALKENNCGQVRGPVQFTFGRSVDPIVTLEHSITRMAVATEAEAKKQSGDNRTMGRKNTVPYGLYVSHGFISAHLARQTGFTEADLGLLWDALVNMFEHDRSAARGLMSAQKLIVFKHDSPLGSAPAGKLFARVEITLKDNTKPPREFSDYNIAINTEGMPAGVALNEML